MKHLTDAQISGLSIRQINAIFREQDDSALWPICGRFNATDRAIRRLRKLRRDGLELAPGLEYWLALETEISRIVNSEC